MTGHASRVGQFVVVVHVALRARQGGMRAGQRPSGFAVVELRPRPGRRAVARVTGGGESRRLMVRIGGVVVVIHVTGAASTAGQVVVAVHMALRAGESGVLPRQREPSAGVIELPTSPRVRVVAVLTSRRYVGLRVIRIGGSLIVLQVAGHTGGIGDVVIVIDVALRARSFCMRPGQGETGFRVIKDRIGPRRGVVARITSCRKPGLLVIRIGGAVVILHVAGGAGAASQVVVPVNVTLRAG